ncbi:hypothetical protein BaRGS_00031054, partial [Batillaria attramentaria]
HSSDSQLSIITARSSWLHQVAEKNKCNIPSFQNPVQSSPLPPLRVQSSSTGVSKISVVFSAPLSTSNCIRVAHSAARKHASTPSSHQHLNPRGNRSIASRVGMPFVVSLMESEQGANTCKSKDKATIVTRGAVCSQKLERLDDLW